MSKESWRKELKTLLTVREVWSLIPVQVKAKEMTPKAAAATFLRCCVVQPLSRRGRLATCYTLRRNSASVMKFFRGKITTKYSTHPI